MTFLESTYLGNAEKMDQKTEMVKNDVKNELNSINILTSLSTKFYISIIEKYLIIGFTAFAWLS